MNKLKLLFVVVCAAVIINISATLIRKNFLDKVDNIAKYRSQDIHMEYDIASK